MLEAGLGFRVQRDGKKASADSCVNNQNGDDQQKVLEGKGLKGSVARIQAISRQHQYACRQR